MASFKCLSSTITLSRGLRLPKQFLFRNVAACKNLDAVRYSSAYEGDGKTHTVMLNDDTQRIMINSYSEIGFTMNNGLSVVGPIAVFPSFILSWNVGDVVHINKESLSLFLLLEPKLDILILGLPQYKKTNRETMKNIASFIRKYKIQVEVLPTEIACPTFNFLTAEERFVAAAIVPPVSVMGEDVVALNKPSRLGSGFDRIQHKP